MPLLENPTDVRLYCYALGRHIAPGEQVEITDEQAAEVSLAVFRIATAAAVEVSAPAPEADPAVAEREVVTRGADEVEITAPPAVETR